MKTAQEKLEQRIDKLRTALNYVDFHVRKIVGATEISRDDIYKFQDLSTEALSEDDKLAGEK